MTLKDQLEQQKAVFLTRVPTEVQEDILGLVKKQQQSGIDYGLKEGDQAPNFTLNNPLGEQITLYDELVRGPVVLTFYRGGWCPFCNIQLRSYQRILPEMEKHGARLIAISPQSPDNTLSQKEKEELTFQVLSDPNGVVSDRYHLLFELPDSLQQTYIKLGRDFGEYNNTDRWILPVPATFIIDQDGLVRRAYVDPDFMKRMEPEEIIELLNRI